MPASWSGIRWLSRICAGRQVAESGNGTGRLLTLHDRLTGMMFCVLNPMVWGGRAGFKRRYSESGRCFWAKWCWCSGKATGDKGGWRSAAGNTLCAKVHGWRARPGRLRRHISRAAANRCAGAGGCSGCSTCGCAGASGCAGHCAREGWRRCLGDCAREGCSSSGCGGRHCRDNRFWRCLEGCHAGIHHLNGIPVSGAVRYGGVGELICSASGVRTRPADKTAGVGIAG